MKNFFSYAFRPFFLLNGLFAVAAVAVWLLALHGEGPEFLPVNAAFWHGHEMLIGFAMATIAGFVLTAVSTWTGRPAVHGAPLVLLVLAWVAGRAAMLTGGMLPAVWVAVLDMLFPLLLIVFVAREIIGGGSQRNYPIVFITVLFALFNLCFHLSQLGVLHLSLDADRISLYLLIHLVLLLVTVIAGRIVPAFTANWLRMRGHQSRLPVVSARVDQVTILLTIATGLFAAFLPLNPVTGVLAFAAAVAHGFRLSRWCGLSSRQEPLLFVLHVAYLWLPLGYGLLGCAVFGWVFPLTVALHALTMGGIGFMVLAVTTRVALGHTGRPLRAAGLTVAAYWILMAAVVLRVLSPLTGHYLAFVDMAAVGWMLAFAIFSWVYGPYLIGPKAE